MDHLAITQGPPTTVSFHIQWKHFLGYPEYFYIFRNALQSALQNLNLFGLACVAGAERGGGGRKAQQRGKGKGAPYQLSSIPLSFFHFSYPLPFSKPATQASSVILGHLKSFRNYKGFSIIFPTILGAIYSFTKVRISLGFESVMDHHIFESETFRFPFSTKNCLPWAVKCAELNFTQS